MTQTDLNKLVQEILRIKTEREICKHNQIKFNKKYREALGRVQECSRKINDLLNELEQFRQSK